jgi:hypothetical protein
VKVWASTVWAQVIESKRIEFGCVMLGFLGLVGFGVCFVGDR